MSGFGGRRHWGAELERLELVCSFEVSFSALNNGQSGKPAPSQKPRRSWIDSEDSFELVTQFASILGLLSPKIVDVCRSCGHRSIV